MGGAYAKSWFASCCRFRRRVLPALLPYLIVFAVLGGLRFGNPQWNRWIFIFQAYVSPGDPNRLLWPPQMRAAAHSCAFCFDPDGFTGVWRTWEANGELHSEREFVNNLPHGIWRGLSGSETPWGDSIRYEMHYRRGKLHGKAARAGLGVADRFFGTLPFAVAREEAEYVDGKQVGPLVYFYANGDKCGEIEYCDGDKERETTWFPGGKKRRERFFSNGRPSGTWIYWNPDGTVARTENGTLSGGAYAGMFCEEPQETVEPTE